MQFLIRKLSSVLKGYSSLRSDTYAVTGLDYISEDPKTPFRIDLINWNDIMPVELRDSTVDGGVSVRMVPVSEDHNCAPVKWPSYRNRL